MKACAEAAGRVLKSLDPVCRGLVITGCLDEIFFHGKPVLVGVEPHSMAWVLGEHAVDRSGSTWTEALQGFDALEQAVVDGGSGLRRGLADFQSQRTIAGNSTPLEVSLDVFHTKQEAQRVLRKLWNCVESRWTRAEEADRQVARAWRNNGGDRRGFGGAAGKAWKKVERAMERYDHVERAWKRIETALELFRPDGRLNDRAWAEGEIAAAVKDLEGAEWGKLRRALADRRSLTFWTGCSGSWRRRSRGRSCARHWSGVGGCGGSRYRRAPTEGWSRTLRVEAVGRLPRWFRRSTAGNWQ